VRSRISNDVAVTEGRLHHPENAAKFLFWNILPVSRLFAIFCGCQGVSRLGKYCRIKNLASSTKKIIQGALRISPGSSFVPDPDDELSPTPPCRHGR